MPGYLAGARFAARWERAASRLHSSCTTGSTAHQKSQVFPQPADFCGTIRMKSLHPQSRCVTCRRTPEVSSTAFDAQPPDLPPVRLMDLGFAILCSLARHPRPHIRFLFIGSRLCSTLLSGPRLAASVISSLRFAMTSLPSTCQRDFHPQAVEHARQHKKQPRFWALSGASE